MPVSSDRPALHELRQMAQDMALSSSWPLADEVLRLALRALQESEGIIARQRAELDAVTQRVVYHCLDRDLDDVMLTCMGESDGVILRTTDTGRELELAGSSWVERTSA